MTVNDSLISSEIDSWSIDAVSMYTMYYVYVQAKTSAM